MESWPFNTDFSRLGGGSRGLPSLIGDLGDVGDVLGANWERSQGGINDNGSVRGRAVVRWIGCIAIANSSIVR
jgi:hypothetical protein